LTDIFLARAVATVADNAAGVPLCVDVDGTLVKSDTLHDSLLVIIQRNPELLLRLPSWLLQGKALFKEKIASSVTLDVAHLPYNRSLLEFLQQQHAAGRPIYLATASDHMLAEAIASHLGIFAGIMASDGTTNLSGANKLAIFRAKFPEGFCYIGNALPDAAILQSSVCPMVANPHRRLLAAMSRARVVPTHCFADRAPLLNRLKSAMRMHQWAKNVLIFLPLLLAHGRSIISFAAAAVAFLSFSFCASATYILNDLLDIESDRRHPTKRFRPFAAGDISAPAGLGLIAALAVLSVCVALLLPLMPAAPGGAHGSPGGFLLWLAFYAATTVIYSTWLKRLVLIDTVTLSGLYTLRILAGSSATGYMVSPWLASFSIFFFLSLAFVKRFSELENLRIRGAVKSSGRGYRVGDLEQLRIFGSSSAFTAVVVFTLYINNPTVSGLYRHPLRLWLLTPILILWLCRIWLKASRGELQEDPVIYALSDWHSLVLGILSAAVLLFAAIAR